MGEIEDSLAGKAATERNDLKVRALAKLTGETFTRGAYTLTIEQGPRVVIVKGTPVLEMVVSVTRNGKPVAIDGHLRFVNPPIKVPDGTFNMTGVTPTGEAIRRENTVESPREALRKMVLDAVVGQLR